MDLENSQKAVNELVPRVHELLTHQRTREARALLVQLMEPEVADILGDLEPAEKAVAFRLLPRDEAARVFAYLAPDEQERLLHGMHSEQVGPLLDAMSPDDRAEFFEELPGQVVAKLLLLLRPEERKQTQAILAYPEQSVGRLMTPDYLTVRPDWTVQQALDYLRQHGRDAETLHTIYVTDEPGKLLDDIRLRQLVLASPHQTVESLMDRTIVPLYASSDREEAVRVMERYDRPVLPVVDRDGVLVGIVTFDDVADVAAAEATEDIQKMGGVEALEVPYSKITLTRLIRKRGTWLLILFMGEILTASAMGYFQDELSRAVVLALFIPLIISSGGNSGSQASTLIIRALAIREISVKDWRRVLGRELVCGVALGLLLAAIGLVRVLLWQWLGWQNYTNHYALVAFTVAAAVAGVVLWGTIVGSMLPFILILARLDPAAISAPLVATLVDVTGLVIYFSVAFLILRGSLLG